MVNKTIRTFLRQLQSTDSLKGKRITCGFSGGPDSTALLLALYEAQNHYQFTLSATFFHHGSNSMATNEDEALSFCIDFCSSRSIPFNSVYLNLQKENRLGWESSARKLRLSYYNNQDSDFIFLGHHRDDQDETTLIQLFRGGKGVTGMSPIQGKFCRPFLSLSKSDLISYLQTKDISWIVDTSNVNTELTRNYWRNEIMPHIATLYPDYSKKLSNFREQAQELYDLSKELAYSDSLNELLSGQEIDISLLNDIRLKNLIKHFFTHLSINKEGKFYEHQISHYRKNRQIYISLSGHTLILNNGSMYYSSFGLIVD